jgi:hypothetical protein
MSGEWDKMDHEKGDPKAWPVNIAAPRTTSKANEPSGPKEKRAFPRFKCEGSVELRSGAGEVRTWGTVTDISLSGCYVEMQATFPVGERLNLLIEINRVRFRTGGQVRTNYPFLGMGISFEEISEAEGQNLRMIVASLENPRTHAQSPLELGTLRDSRRALELIAAAFQKCPTLGREEFLRILREC